MKTLYIFLLIAGLLLFPQSIWAKRTAPAPVTPVIFEGVRYEAPHWGIANGRTQNGGYVEAWDIKENKLLWAVKVYDVKYDLPIERDIQDVFITAISIKNGCLFVSNERGEEYLVNLQTHEVSQEYTGPRSVSKSWWQFWK